MNHGKVSKEIASGLLALKKRIAAAKIPSSKIDETLNIASWNIREFGKVRRTDAAIHYIAEILGQFELDFYVDAAHIKELFPAGLTKEKFTFQLSDHLPLWMQIKTDIDGQKLDEIIQA